MAEKKNIRFTRSITLFCLFGSQNGVRFQCKRKEVFWRKSDMSTKCTYRLRSIESIFDEIPPKCVSKWMMKICDDERNSLATTDRSTVDRSIPDHRLIFLHFVANFGWVEISEKLCALHLSQLSNFSVFSSANTRRKCFVRLRANIFGCFEWTYTMYVLVCNDSDSSKQGSSNHRTCCA